MSTVTEQSELGLKQEQPTTVPPVLTVTEKAASEVMRIVQEHKHAGAAEQLYLRVRVVGGGCSGFQNKLDLDTHVDPKRDELFEQHGITVVIDKRSKVYLQGAVIDFHDDLNRRGFSVTNPN